MGSLGGATYVDQNVVHGHSITLCISAYQQDLPFEKEAQTGGRVRADPAHNAISHSCSTYAIFT